MKSTFFASAQETSKKAKPNLLENSSAFSNDTSLFPKSFLFPTGKQIIFFGIRWHFIGIRSTGDEHCKKPLDGEHSWHQLNLDGRVVINIFLENTTLEIVVNFSKIPQLAYFTEK